MQGLRATQRVVQRLRAAECAGIGCSVPCAETPHHAVAGHRSLSFLCFALLWCKLIQTWFAATDHSSAERRQLSKLRPATAHSEEAELFLAQFQLQRLWTSASLKAAPQADIARTGGRNILMLAGPCVCAHEPCQAHIPCCTRCAHLLCHALLRSNATHDWQGQAAQTLSSFNGEKPILPLTAWDGAGGAR